MGWGGGNKSKGTEHGTLGDTSDPQQWLATVAFLSGTAHRFAGGLCPFVSKPPREHDKGPRKGVSFWLSSEKQGSCVELIFFG